MKKKIVIGILVGILLLSMTGCNSDTDEESLSASEEEIIEDNLSEVTGEVTVVGQVVSVVGNIISVQVGTYIESANGMEGGEFPEGMDSMMGELSEEDREAMMEGGEFPEGMDSMMGELSEEEMEAMMEDGELPEGMDSMMEGGEFPEGMDSMMGELSEEDREAMMEDGEFSEEMGEFSQGTGMQGMMGSDTMQGMTGIQAVDMSEAIELTEEIVEIMLPTSTAVYSMGVAYDFTDIVEECYITIMEDEDGNIVAVNILG